MTDETQSQIYQTILESGFHVWINLAHVVSVQHIEPIENGQKGWNKIRVSMSNNDLFEISCCPRGTDLTVGFLYALNAYHNQNK